MSSFNLPLTVTQIGGFRWRVERAFIYYIDSLDSPSYIEVPEGFETDFASVPRAFWWLFPPAGKYTQAAVVHDYLYTYHANKFKMLNGQMIDEVCKKKRADNIFRQAMKVLGVKYWTRFIMWSAVSLFGQGAWDNGPKKLINPA